MHAGGRSGEDKAGIGMGPGRAESDRAQCTHHKPPDVYVTALLLSHSKHSQQLVGAVGHGGPVLGQAVGVEGGLPDGPARGAVQARVDRRSSWHACALEQRAYGWFSSASVHNSLCYPKKFAGGLGKGQEALT